MNITKQISIMMFGSVAWLFCAAAMPMQHNGGQAALALSDFFASSAYASDDDEHEHEAQSSSSVCVSLAKLEDREREDVDAERHDAEDEHHHAEDEHHDAHDAHVNGDNDAEAEHEEQAREHEERAAEHEDKADEYESKADEIHALHGNCTALVTDPNSGEVLHNLDGTPKTEAGVWVSDTVDGIDAALAERGGAGQLIDSVLAGGSTVTGSATPDGAMMSYREIQGR